MQTDPRRVVDNRSSKARCGTAPPSLFEYTPIIEQYLYKNREHLVRGGRSEGSIKPFCRKRCCLVTTAVSGFLSTLPLRGHLVIHTHNKSRKNIKQNMTDSQTLPNQQNFPPLATKPIGRADFRPAPCPPPPVNAWHRPPKINAPQPAKETPKRVSQQPLQQRTGAAASALGEDITTIMSILQVVRSAEVTDLAAKFRNAKHSVDRLCIILENQDLINKLENL